MMNQILANNSLLEQLPANVQEQVKDIMARILKLAGYRTAELEHGFEFHWGHLPVQQECLITLSC